MAKTIYTYLLEISIDNRLLNQFIIYAENEQEAQRKTAMIHGDFQLHVQREHQAQCILRLEPVNIGNHLNG